MQALSLREDGMYHVKVQPFYLEALCRIGKTDPGASALLDGLLESVKQKKLSIHFENIGSPVCLLPKLKDHHLREPDIYRILEEAVNNPCITEEELILFKIDMFDKKMERPLFHQNLLILSFQNERQILFNQYAAAILLRFKKTVGASDFEFVNYLFTHISYAFKDQSTGKFKAFSEKQNELLEYLLRIVHKKSPLFLIHYKKNVAGYSTHPAIEEMWVNIAANSF